MQVGKDLEIKDLIAFCGLDERYVHVFTAEKICSLSAFRQFLKVNNSGLTSTFLERTQMPCGDFLKLQLAALNLPD